MTISFENNNDFTSSETNEYIIFLSDGFDQDLFNNSEICHFFLSISNGMHLVSLVTIIFVIDL